MAASDYYLRFRQKSTDELRAKEAALEAQESAFVSQTDGERSYQKDLQFIRDQLNAIALVLRERSSAGIIPTSTLNPSIGTVNFSNLP